MKMKKAIIFVICLLVIVYAIVAVLLIDFNGIGTSNAKAADDWMILQYKCVDNDGNYITDTDGGQILYTENVPLYINSKTGIKETKTKKTRLESAKLFKNPGYDFDAWYIGGKRYAAGAWLEGGLTANYLEVLPRWTPKLYQITFDPMGGSPVPSRAWVRYGDTYGSVISANSYITKANNDFAGWWTTPTQPSVVTGNEQIFPWTTVDITENTTLYAHWNPNIGGITPTYYNINFHGNGHTGGSMGYQTALHGSSITLNPNGFWKTNFRFDGWSTGATGGVVFADMARINNLQRSWDLYAIWSPDGIDTTIYKTVSYDANGGNVAAPWQDTVPQYSQISLPYYSGTNGNQTFGGWTTNPWGSGTVYAAGSTFTVADTVTLYAKWNDAPVTPTYWLNGQWAGESLGSGSSISGGGEVQQGDSGYITFNAGAGRYIVNISRGNVISGTLGSSQIIGVSVPNITSNVTVTATVAINQTTNTYDLSGAWTGDSRGTGASISGGGAITHGGTGTLTFNAGSGKHITNISAGNITSGTLGSSQTVTVQVPNMTYSLQVIATVGTDVYNVTVSFDSAGGSSVSSKTVTVNSTYGSLGTPTRSGYTFNGWYTASSGGSQVTSSTVVTNYSNHTLYARWTADAVTLTVSFDSAGGTSISSKTVTVNSTYGSLGTPTRSGYTFAGWWTSSSGGSQVTNSTTVTNSSNHTLYAHWTSNTVTVTVSFDSAGGSSVSSKTATVGSTYGSLSTPSRSGFTFAGWYTASSGGSQVTSSTAVTNSSNHTLYARWTADAVVVTVSFNSAGGTSVSSKSVTVGSTYGTLGTSTRTGFTFAGWKDTYGYTITSSSTVSISSNHTLTAQWTQNVTNVTVSFDSTGGTSVSSKTVTVNSTYGSLGTPTRSGYTFNGWYTASSGGSQVTSSTTVTNSSNHTLYAHWTQNAAATVTVSFNSAGGTSVSSKSVTVGSTYGSLGTPTRTGFTFAGWWTASSGGSQVTSSTTVTNSSNHTLYARWA